jgi:Zn ribbon nucleic-acid-binding protein
MGVATKKNTEVLAPVLVEGTPLCPFCQKQDYMKADTLQMTTVRGVFECVSCGLLRLAKAEEMDIWAKMKGRRPPTPPDAAGKTLDHELVARSTNIARGS